MMNKFKQSYKSDLIKNVNLECIDGCMVKITVILYDIL